MPFCVPKFGIAHRRIVPTATFVHVPEATVHNDPSRTEQNVSYPGRRVLAYRPWDLLPPFPLENGAAEFLAVGLGTRLQPETRGCLGPKLSPLLGPNPP